MFSDKTSNIVKNWKSVIKSHRLQKPLSRLNVFHQNSSQVCKCENLLDNAMALARGKKKTPVRPGCETAFETKYYVVINMCNDFKPKTLKCSSFENFPEWFQIFEISLPALSSPSLFWYFVLISGASSNKRKVTFCLYREWEILGWHFYLFHFRRNLWYNFDLSTCQCKMTARNWQVLLVSLKIEILLYLNSFRPFMATSIALN